MSTEREHAHELLERLEPEQLAAVVQLMETMAVDHEPLSEEDRRAVTASREFFRRNPEGGLSLEQVAADLGFTMDQIRGKSSDSET